MKKQNSKIFINLILFFLNFSINTQDLEVILEPQDIQIQIPKVHKKNISVMLDPAGDAQNIGRLIDDGFERNITLQLAQEIKNFFDSDGSISIILSRIAGESLEPLQNISFANRLNVDLYININVCQNPEYKNYQTLDNSKKIFIYYHILNPILDKWPKKIDNLSLIKIDEVYLKNISKSIDLAKSFEKNLKNSTKKISVNSPIGVPLKELIGLKSPALSLEIIVNTKSDIKNFVEPICQALKNIAEVI